MCMLLKPLANHGVWVKEYRRLSKNFCVKCMVANSMLTIWDTKSTASNTAKNIVISPDFLVWKFCGKAQFPHTVQPGKSDTI